MNNQCTGGFAMLTILILRFENHQKGIEGRNRARSQKGGGV